MRDEFPDVMHVILDEVQSFRAEDGDWLEKAKRLVCQHSRHPRDSGLFSDSDDPEPGESSDCDAELNVEHHPHSCLDTQSDDNAGSSSDSESSDVSVAGSHASRLSESGPGFLWMFIDSNQVNHVFRTGIPPTVNQIPSYRLSKVIRNSKRIFNYAKRYLKTGAMNKIEIGHDFPGEGIVVRRYPRGQQIRSLNEVLQDLLKEGYSEGDIAILFEKVDVIPSFLNIQLGLEQIADAEHDDSEHVVVSSFRMYSGLERPVVILTDVVTPLSASKYSLLNGSLYCAVTRAMTKLIFLEREEGKKRKNEG